MKPKPLPEHKLIQETMQAMAAASAKVLAGHFFFSERQVGMFTLLVQKEFAEAIGTDDLQADIERQITELEDEQ